MTKRILCLLLAALALAGLATPALASQAPAAEGTATVRSALAPPTVTIANTASGIKVTWNKISGAARYAVYYRVGGGAWHKIGTTPNTSYTWKKAVVGKSYTFTVRCTNENKVNISPYVASNTVTYYPLAAPTVSISNAANGIKVTWNKISGAARYAVYYRIGGGSWHKIGTTTATSYTWKKAVSGTNYAFTVRCTDSKKVNISPYVASNALTWLAQPAVKAANRPFGMLVSWKKIAGAAQYRVYFKAENSGGWNLIGSTTGESYLWDEELGGPVVGNRYSFTVRAVSGGSASAYTGTSYLLYKPAASDTDA